MAVGLAAIQKGQSVPGYAALSKVTAQQRLRWFDGVVTWDGEFAGARNVFMKIGIGAIHLYDQPPRDGGRERSRGAVHHLGMQVVGIDDLHARMTAAGLSIRSAVRRFPGGAYFMVEAPDAVLIEVFEPAPDADPRALAYYGLGGDPG